MIGEGDAEANVATKSDFVKKVSGDPNVVDSGMSLFVCWGKCV